MSSLISLRISVDGMTHFMSRQGIVYSAPEEDSRTNAWLTRGMLVRVTNNLGEWQGVMTETGRIGFVKSGLLEEYFPPFDLSQAAIYHPQDVQIVEALNAWRPAQYIKLDYLGIRKMHYNLCGEFCAAALLNMDVMPLLAIWQKEYSRARTILVKGSGTGFADLQSLVRCGKLIDYPAPSPRLLQKAGLCIAGVGINGQGQVLHSGGIRHWVIVLEVLPVDRTAWVRIYNPMWNREECVLFDEMLDRNWRLSVLAGLERIPSRADAGK